MIHSIALLSVASLAIVWIVYPIGIAALAIVRRRPTISSDGGDAPMVSVVVATQADAEAIHARVTDLLATRYAPDRIEVIVAVDSRNDQAVVGFRDLDERVRMVRGDDPGGKAATLNAGVRAARGEALVFADTHQRFDSETIPHLVAALADPRVGAATGSLRLAEVQTPSAVQWYWRFERWIRRSEAQVHSTVGVTGAIYAMHRSLWTPLPSGLILDDLYVPMNVIFRRFRVVWVENARAYETRRPTGIQEYRRKVRTLTGNIQLCVWLPGVLVPFRNPIWFQFLFHKVLRLLTPYWAIAVGLWMAIAGVRWAGAHPSQAALAGAALLVFGVVARPSAVRSVAGFLYQSMLMQAAVIVATVNGLRGRWDVWAK